MARAYAKRTLRPDTSRTIGMDQKKLIIILADISGYTRFMLENQTSAALHGQLVINGLIESIIQQVDIPLTLQEIEGDAVFLYAAHPGSDAAWGEVVEQVSRKLATCPNAASRSQGGNPGNIPYAQTETSYSLPASTPSGTDFGTNKPRWFIR